MNNPLQINPWDGLNEPPEVFQMLGDLLCRMALMQYEQMYKLLLDMLDDGALAYRWETANGRRQPVFYALNPGPYADRIMPTGEEDDDDFVITCCSAAVIKLFLNGHHEFVVSTEPRLDIGWIIRSVPPDDFFD